MLLDQRVDQRVQLLGRQAVAASASSRLARCPGSRTSFSGSARRLSAAWPSPRPSTRSSSRMLLVGRSRRRGRSRSSAPDSTSASVYTRLVAARGSAGPSARRAAAAGNSALDAAELGDLGGGVALRCRTITRSAARIDERPAGGRAAQLRERHTFARRAARAAPGAPRAGLALQPVEQALGHEVDAAGRPSRSQRTRRQASGAAAQNQAPMIVLGIDPGLANTGYGVVAAPRRAARGAGRRRDRDARRSSRRSGASAEHPRGARARCCASTSPTRWRSRSCTSAQNVRTAFAVGQARGVVMLVRRPARACRALGYTPQQVKGAVCGSGRAPKDQVARMVATLLGAAGAAAARPRRRRAGGRDLPRQPRAARASRSRQVGRAMIALLRGEVAVRRPDHVVAAVRRRRLPAGGLRRRRSRTSRRSGEQVTLHTHLIVRDDALVLYGLHSEQERDLFLMLLSRPGGRPEGRAGGALRRAAARADRRDRRRRRARFQAVPGGRQAHRRADHRRAAREGRRRAAASGIVRAPRRRGAPTSPRLLAREGLLELGYAPAEAERAARRRRAARAPRSCSPRALRATARAR